MSHELFKCLPMTVTAEEFSAIVEQRITKLKNTLLAKGEEYAVDGDRMHNFNTAARMDNETPEMALWGMWKKHIISIRDMVSDTEKSGKAHTPEMINEKLGDNVAYTCLLEGLMLARFRKTQIGAEIPANIAKAGQKVQGVDHIEINPNNKPSAKKTAKKKAVKKKAVKKTTRKKAASKNK